MKDTVSQGEKKGICACLAEKKVPEHLLQTSRDKKRGTDGDICDEEQSLCAYFTATSKLIELFFFTELTSLFVIKKVTTLKKKKKKKIFCQIFG